jgi:hypothetical protein
LKNENGPKIAVLVKVKNAETDVLIRGYSTLKNTPESISLGIKCKMSFGALLSASKSSMRLVIEVGFAVYINGICTIFCQFLLERESLAYS